MSSPHTPEPCPFCGEKLVKNDNPEDLYVKRYGPHYHHLTTSTCYLAEDEVTPGGIARWNKRAAPEPLTDERADALRLDWLIEGLSADDYRVICEALDYWDDNWRVCQPIKAKVKALAETRRPFNERAEFEASMRSCSTVSLQRDPEDPDDYYRMGARMAWVAWQIRADLELPGARGLAALRSPPAASGNDATARSDEKNEVGAALLSREVK